MTESKDSELSPKELEEKQTKEMVERLSKMSKKEKFQLLDGLVLDGYILQLSVGNIQNADLSQPSTYLKNNKIVNTGKIEDSEADVIDGLVE